MCTILCICTGCCEQSGTIGTDCQISDASNSDTCCLSSPATGSTVGTLNKSLNKFSSPVWLSARNKLQKFAFQKSDTKHKQGRAGATKPYTYQKDKPVDIGSATCNMKEGKLLSHVQVSTLTLFSIFVGIYVSIANSPSPPNIGRSILQPVPLSPKEKSELVQVETGSGDDDTQTEDDEDSLSESEDDYSDKQKEVIMEFLNNSSQEELCDIPGCSMTKAKLLAQHLPVDKWEDLVSGSSGIA